MQTDDMRGNWEINTKKESPWVLPVLRCSLSLFSTEEKQRANLKAVFMDFHQIYGFIYYLQLRSVTTMREHDQMLGSGEAVLFLHQDRGYKNEH